MRPKRKRRIKGEPENDFFKPAGVPKKSLETLELELDEYEALRLNHIEEKTQKEAADEMDVSQPTFNRILESAEQKMASAVVEGKALKVKN